MVNWSASTIMADELKLNKPWLVAVWPGMGHVAVNAAYYLMAKLGVFAEYEDRFLDLFKPGDKS